MSLTGLLDDIDAAIATIRQRSADLRAALATQNPLPPSGITLRLLQWNSHHGAQGTDGVYNPDRFCDWVAKMNPDVCGFNEVETAGTASGFTSRIRQRLKTATWMGGYDGAGNAIVARAASANFLPLQIDPLPAFVLLATLPLDAIQTIRIGATHLHVSDAAKRMSELQATIAAQAHILLMDGNFQPSSPEYAALVAAGYRDGWSAAAVRIGDGATKGSARIDYVWVHQDLHARVLTAEIVDTRDANGVRPSDHNPLVVTITL